MSAAIYVPQAGAAIPSASRIGGKGHALAKLAQLAGEGGFDVAPFLVVESAHFTRHLQALGPRPQAQAELMAWRDRIRTSELPAKLRSELRAALQASGLNTSLVALRSSAASEDGKAHSFAGQFDTLLGVRCDAEHDQALWDALRAVWASAFSEHALAYAQQQAIAADLRMAVVIQTMIDPEVSGVAFSVDPVHGDAQSVLISSVYGLGEGLVSGEFDADTYRVGQDETVSAAIVAKPLALRLAPDGGTQSLPVSEALVRAPSLTGAQALRIAAVARWLESRLGAPQDIEWAWSGDRLIVLQTRPITGGQRNIWDNSNIIESYSGVTTPLTFSFALGVYEEVYLQFCRLVGVPESMLQERRELFANMLGLARGRVYYNLLNWYRMLSLLPGFRFNRAFMERMMGVRESLTQTIESPAKGGRLADLLHLLRTTARLFREGQRIDRQVVRFQAHVQATLAPLAKVDFGSWSSGRLVAEYHRLEDALLRRWQTPIVNDFLAMMFFGVLGRLTERWLPAAPPTLVNDLLCGEGGIISTEPARRIMALAQQIRKSSELRALFDSQRDAHSVWTALRRDARYAELATQLDQYLDRFGNRCMEELKLETITLGEDPTPLVPMLRAYLAADKTDAGEAWQRELAIRRAAEARVNTELDPLRRRIHRYVLSRTRARVRDRENLRFERTRVFGTVRRIYKALGERLVDEGRLASPRDVFYLRTDEIFGLFEQDLQLDTLAITQARRAEFEEYARTPAPPERFETFGPASRWKPGDSGAAAKIDPDLRQLQGTGCCPGIVHARVRVVRDPRDADQLSGRILVAERTDPGWTLLFPAVSGLLVQRGSLLSHSAIVAREMGIPCIVGIAGLLDVLRDGEEVEMDGTVGSVVRRDPASGAA